MNTEQKTLQEWEKTDKMTIKTSYGDYVVETDCVWDGGNHFNVYAYPTRNNKRVAVSDIGSVHVLVYDEKLIDDFNSEIKGKINDNNIKFYVEKTEDLETFPSYTFHAKTKEEVEVTVNALQKIIGK